MKDDIDFDELAHFEMSGGNIKSAIFRAAARAALRYSGMINLKWFHWFY